MSVLYQSMSILYISVCLVLMIPSTLLLPVHSPYQRFKKSIEPEPIYQGPQEAANNQETVHVKEGTKGRRDADPSAVDVNTSETLRKINPLTIAEQVSELLRKQNQRATLTNSRPSSALHQEIPGSLTNQAPSVEANNQQSSGGNIMQSIREALLNNKPSPISSPERSAKVDSEDSIGDKAAQGQEGYIRQEPPKIINKPRPKDNLGYSVVVMAGDSVKVPIQVNGKTLKNQQKQQSDVKGGCNSVWGSAEAAPKVFRKGESADKLNPQEKSSKKEVRVSKHYGKYPDFPVYDEDFNFVPDPFQGLLDKNYWKTEEKNDVPKLAVPMDSYRIGEFGFEPHNILMRSNDDNVDETKVKAARQACGGGRSAWKKSNNTVSSVV